MFNFFKKDKGNECHTYFAITGDFDPAVVTEMLGLQPYKSWKTGDLRRNGTVYDFSRWCYGLCEEYNPCTDEQVGKTISDLLPKVDILKQIHEKFDVDFYIEIVPTVKSRCETPSLFIPSDIIDFCHETHTEIDIDLYTY